MSKNYVGDVGTEILVDVGSPVDTATTLKFYVKKPSGKEIEWEAELGPVNAQGQYTTMRYVVQPGDWDEPGFWILQAYVVLPSWSGRGDSVKFKLEPEFS